MFDDFKKKVISPIEFVKPGESYQITPIEKLEQVNGVTSFAILKTTEGGKYMRGNMLYYNLNGVSIYTDANNIIFVDTQNNTMWVREYEKVLKEIEPDNPEQKQYVLLYVDLMYENEETEYPFRWEAVTGRTNAYENIKINAPVIDLDKSIVLVETVSFKDSLSIRQFVDYLHNANIIEDESFDTSDWSGSDYI